jgi:hypothetical protein
MKIKTLWFAMLGLSLFLPACATNKSVHQNSPASTSGVENSSMAEDTLYFGMNTPKGQLTSAQWETFLKEEVTSRFPEGLTVWDAKGQWRDKDGVPQKENTKVLLLIHPDNPKESQAIQEIIDAYKKQFHQESVMRVKSRPEVSF